MTLLPGCASAAVDHMDSLEQHVVEAPMLHQMLDSSPEFHRGGEHAHAATAAAADTDSTQQRLARD